MSFPTLPDYFDSHFLSIWIRGKSLDPKTERSYRESIKLWAKLSPNATVDKITQQMIGEFVAALRVHPGKKKGTMMFPASIAKHCRQLDTLLKTCGPAGRKNRFGQGLLDREAPFFPPIKVSKNPPAKDFTMDEMHAMYRAASTMKNPRVDGVAACDWWRCLLVVAYYSGLRIGELVQLRCDHIHDQLLTVPPEIAKGDKGSRHWLPKEAIEHIQRIRTADREQVFHVGLYTTQRRLLYDHFDVLEVTAGIPKIRRFRFHSIRKCHVTQLANLSAAHRDDLKIAQRSAGHASISITTGFYASGSLEERRVWEAIERLESPVPLEFRNGHAHKPVAESPPKSVERPNLRWREPEEFID